MSAHRLDTILSELADGRWHRLPDPAGVQRALEEVELQVEIDSAGRGRLPEAIELLDAGLIRSYLDAATATRTTQIDVHTTIDSTNSELLRHDPPAPGEARVCLAEFQRAGRGRRGRSWIAPCGHALCLSVAWHFKRLPRHLSAASLAVGVGIAQALRQFGVAGVQLKWPNDLVCAGRKLGGILIDAHGAADDLCLVVGVGLNLRVAPGQQQRIGELNGVTAAGLACLDAALAHERNRLAAALVREIVTVLEQFGDAGLTPWAEQWRELDMLSGEVVEVSGPEHTFTGRALGIDEAGALLVQHGDTVRRVLAGEVSVRAQ